MPSHSTAVLLVNSKSRRGAECYSSALARFSEQGIHLEKSIQTSNVARLVDAAKEAVKNGIPLVVVGGGDGTLSAVAEPLVGTSATMAVLPLGTGNSLARDLQIPIDVAEACEIAVGGRPAKISIGRVSGQIFLNVATVGLSTRIASHLTDPMKRRFGRLVYAAALAQAYRELRPFRAVLNTENGREEFDSLQIVIGNGRFHAGPFPVLPDASIFERKLSIYALEARTKAELFKFALFLPGGRHVRLNEVHSQHSKGGKLSTLPEVRVTVDGEIKFRTPVEFEVDPKGLRVMIPKEFTAEEGQ